MIVDLRSDTVTRPSAAMRRAMTHAEVGDDVYGEDPTVIGLETRAAELLGKDAALFVPSGTMANQLAIRCFCEPGDEVVMEEGGHSFNFETGAAAALCGVQVRTVRGEAGVFGPGDLDAAIRPDMIAFARTAMVVVENTHNFGGGTIWPPEMLRALAERSRERGLKSHLDGARLLNAAVATGVPAAELAAGFDSVSLALSKGLGAPVGSLLAGGADFVGRARRFRKMLGGGMRQAGILAAAGIYALENNVDRLVEDHVRAQRLAHGLAAIDGLEVDPLRVHTNILFVETRLPAAELAARLKDRGVLASPTAPNQLRLVTHLDIDDGAVDHALTAFEGEAAT